MPQTALELLRLLAQDASADRIDEQARRADDERSMAQRQNRDAGKVEKILPVQVALQWVRAKGAVPLPAVKNVKHAQAIIGCQGWALEENEVAVLDAALPRSVPKFARLR